MASSAPSDAAAVSQVEAAASPPATSTDFGRDIMASLNDISQPVEMHNLPDAQTPAVADPPIDSANMQSSSQTAQPQLSNQTPTDSNPQQQAPGLPSIRPSTQPNDAAPSAGPAIGPATERPVAQQVEGSSGKQLIITLLMHATETRHPYVIDESYLKRRNVTVGEGDPTNMSVYTLKELILRDWRNEWTNKPASPTSIRLIHWGRLLEDKATLKDSRFVSGDTAHVVHMTVKPQEIVDEEDARIAKGGRGDRDGGDRSPTCKCSLM